MTGATPQRAGRARERARARGGPRPPRARGPRPGGAPGRAGLARDAPAAPLGPLGILRIGPFLVLYINATVVLLGVMAQTVARSWLAFQLTGSNAALGGVLLAFGVAMLLAT